MSRPLRIEFPGAWYHVMNRGLAHRSVFSTDDHRQYFLSLVSDTTDRYNAEWHAYCLMGNHYHLMLRTPEGNLQRIMRHINGLYTQYFNRSQRRDGPLFRGRYKAILVDAEAYWLTLSCYIHRNPLEAGLVRHLEDYPWSSYPAFIGKADTPAWLTTYSILRAIGQRNLRARYAAFVAGGVEEEVMAFYGGTRQRPILGDEGFRERVLNGRAESVDIPELRRERAIPSLDAIAKAVCQRLEVDEPSIWQKTRGRGSRSPARAVTMYLCQRIGSMTLSQIAEIFDLASYASSGSTIRTVRQRMEEDLEFKEAIDHILLDLTT